MEIVSYFLVREYLHNDLFKVCILAVPLRDISALAEKVRRVVVFPFAGFKVVCSTLTVEQVRLLV